MAILIVEDDSFYSQFISELLRDRGVATQEVDSAEAALSVNLAEFDCAIIDVMLPNEPDASGISIEESRGGFYTGVAVARRLLQVKNNLKIVLLSSGVSGSDAEVWAVAQSIPFVHKGEESAALIRALQQLGVLGGCRLPLAFIVHGHDEVALLQLKNYVQNTLRWQEPVVLREQPNSGKTLIEKFEDITHEVDCVFVLLTPDEKVVSPTSNEEKRRSRQNVIFEMGFLYKRFGRKSGRILLLHKGPIELPSDIAGIVWIDISNGVEAAGEQIRKEVASIGLMDHNLNRLH